MTRLVRRSRSYCGQLTRGKGHRVSSEKAEPCVHDWWSSHWSNDGGGLSLCQVFCLSFLSLFQFSLVHFFFLTSNYFQKFVYQLYKSLLKPDTCMMVIQVSCYTCRLLNHSSSQSLNEYKRNKGKKKVVLFQPIQRIMDATRHQGSFPSSLHSYFIYAFTKNLNASNAH